MTSNRLFVRIRIMLMKKTILTYLYEYEPKVGVVVPVRNNGVLQGVGWNDFVAYLLTTSYQKNNSNRKRDFEDCLEDCAEKGYIFEGTLFNPTSPNPLAAPPPVVVINHIVISSEGRKLAKGWKIIRWLYFFEYLFREHWLLYGILIFVGGLVVRDPKSVWDIIKVIFSKL